MLRIGWHTQDFTPSRPAMLLGQMHTRVARDALDPLTLTAMAIEGEDGKECAILISCDLVFVSRAMQASIRQVVTQRLPSVPSEAVILFATHTHESLTCEDNFYTHPGGDVMTPAECSAWVVEHAADAACKAWESRVPCAIQRAFGHAVVGHNRRTVYADGHTAMYGATNRPDFVGMEGYEDHSLDMLFAWDARGQLTGLALAIPCPSQVDEGISRFSADFWHEIRLELRRRLGSSLFVLPLCGAAGDQSPHFLLYGRVEEEMRKRRGVSERQEIAQRVADAVERALACTSPDTGTVPLARLARRVGLTPWRSTREDRDRAEAEYRQSIERGADPMGWWTKRLKTVVEEFDHPGPVTPFEIEIHALRIGDTALVTNPFECCLDYGLRIKARSPAAQTVIAQLASGTGWYLPSERSVRGGSYGAVPAVCCVGPVGGQELVEVSLALVQSLFPASAKG